MEGTSWWRKENQIPPGVWSGEGDRAVGEAAIGTCRLRENAADRDRRCVTEVLQ